MRSKTKTWRILSAPILIGLALATILWWLPEASAQTTPTLDAASHPKFINPLPLPKRIDATGGGKLDMEMNEVTQWLGLVDEGGDPLMTTVWGYGKNANQTTYPGPTILTRKDVPIDVFWKNKLPKNKKGFHLLPIDKTLHLARPIKKTLESGNIPVVAHLHGGHTESASDGLPEAWFTQGWAERGPDWVKKIYHYDNDQPGATLWYHDHALGITRLNVYAGLAGFYLLRDSREEALIGNGTLPSGKYEIELAIQDRMFTTDGQLYVPHTTQELINAGFPIDESMFPAGQPTVFAEFFGDFILANGMAWPYLDVEPTKYRIRLLNGSDSRFYALRLEDKDDPSNAPIPFLQIGTDAGLRRQAASLDHLIIAPGERADLVLDFSRLSGKTLRIYNYAADEPFSSPELVAFDPVLKARPTGQIVEFRVNGPASQTFSVTNGATLAQVNFPSSPTKVRRVGLFEATDMYGRLRPMLGSIADEPDVMRTLMWDEEYTETPVVGDTEEWDVYNFTMDAHPVHLHLVSFEVISRRPITFDEEDLEEFEQMGSGKRIDMGKVAVVNAPALPDVSEQGWKDTVKAYPGQVTRIRATFNRVGLYAWHCHILSHEDHEMMRPYYVSP